MQIIRTNAVGRCLEQLRRRHSAQRIGWEIAERAVIPVDILQAAIAVIRRIKRQAFDDALVPCGGQVCRGQARR